MASRVEQRAEAGGPRGAAPGRARSGLRAPLRPLLRAPRRRRQLHAGAARLRQADRDGLLRGPGAVLAFANVVHLFTHELAGFCRWRLALALVAAGPLQGVSLRP